MKPTRILIADDHPLVAESLSMLIETIEDVEVVGTVINGWQAIAFVESNPVDILLSDIHMPLLNGINMAMLLAEQHPTVKVIIVSMSEEASHIKEALQAGVHGYVMKSSERPELVRAIRAVVNNERYFSERIVRKLAELPNPNNTNGKEIISETVPLTKREVEVLRLIVEDLSNVEIGERLHVSSTTIETHRRNLMKKIGVSTAVGLMRWAIKHQLVE